MNDNDNLKDHIENLYTPNSNKIQKHKSSSKNKIHFLKSENEDNFTYNHLDYSNNQYEENQNLELIKNNSFSNKNKNSSNKINSTKLKSHLDEEPEEDEDDNNNNSSLIDEAQDETFKFSKIKKTKEFRRRGYSTNSNRLNLTLKSQRIFLNTIKKKNHEKLLIQNKKKRMEIIMKFIFYVFSNIINILAVINYIIQTFFDETPENDSVNLALTYLELVFTFYFLFEFLFISLKIKGGYCKHLIRIDSLIDMITIVPSIITFFISFRGIKLSFIRVFRIFRVFRILRIYKSLKMIQNESSNQDDENHSGKLMKLDPIKMQFITIVVILICVFFIGAGLILGINDITESAFTLQKFNFVDATYFMIVTYCTLGYGDIIPTSILTRFMIILGIFFLFVIVSDQLSRLANLLKFWGPGIFSYHGKDHVIIIADKTINLKLFLSVLVNNKKNKCDFIIISKDIVKFPSNDPPFNKANLINKEDLDVELLDLINLKNAKAIFLFSTKSNINYDRYDKITDFFLMKLTQNINTTPIYIQTLNYERVLNPVTFNQIFRNNQAYQNKTLKNVKKVIPIWKIKSLILSKCTFNPGFATFIQNLFFNDFTCPVNLEENSEILQHYMLGCENNISINLLPSFFTGKNFFDAMYIIYFKSINDYFVKMTMDKINYNRPVLLIGIYEQHKFYIKNNENIEIFPNDYLINEETYGIFISYDKKDYINKLLETFKNEFYEKLNKKINDVSNNSISFNQDYFSEENKNVIEKKIRKKSRENLDVFCKSNKNLRKNSNLSDVQKNLKKYSSAKNVIEDFNFKNLDNQSYPNTKVEKYHKCNSIKNFQHKDKMIDDDKIKKNEDDSKFDSLGKNKKSFLEDKFYSNIENKNLGKKNSNDSNITEESLNHKIKIDLNKKKSSRDVIHSKIFQELTLIKNDSYSKNLHNSFDLIKDNKDKIRISKKEKNIHKTSIFKNHNFSHNITLNSLNIPKNVMFKFDEKLNPFINNELISMNSEDFNINNIDLELNLGKYNSNLFSKFFNYQNPLEKQLNNDINEVHKIELMDFERISDKNEINKNSFSYENISKKKKNSLDNLMNDNKVHTNEIFKNNKKEEIKKLILNENLNSKNEISSVIKEKEIKILYSKINHKNHTYDEILKKKNNQNSIKEIFNFSKIQDQTTKKSRSFIQKTNSNSPKNFEEEIILKIEKNAEENSTKFSNDLLNPNLSLKKYNSFINRFSELTTKKEKKQNHNLSNNSNKNNTTNKNNNTLRSNNNFLNLFEYGFINSNKFKNENTAQNLEMLNEANNIQKEVFNYKGFTNEMINSKANKLYYNFKQYDELVNIKNIEFNIFDIEKHDLSKRFNNHIIIIGYQDLLIKLLKIIYLHQNRDICIISTPDTDEINIHKLLTQYKNLFYLKGSPENPFHLLNAGLNNAYMVLFLNEKLFGKTNEDMQKILIYKTIDYFFDTKMVLELWSSKSCRLIGNVPLLKNGVIETNEFLHPAFMAGRIIYLSHLEIITAKSFMQEKNTDVWIKLLGLGIKTISSDRGDQTICKDISTSGMPIILTLDIPSLYYEAEYHSLVDDLMKLNPPAIPLGIYVESPLEYLRLRSRGEIKVENSTMGKNTINILTSHKKQLRDLDKTEKINKSYLGNLKILRDISYTEKVFLDIVDLNHSYLPIFITNPHPGLIIPSNCKIMVLYHHLFDKSENLLGQNHINRKIGIRRATINNFKRESSVDDDLRLNQQYLKDKQDKIFKYYDMLKDKLIKSIEKKYTQVSKENRKKFLLFQNNQNLENID